MSAALMGTVLAAMLGAAQPPEEPRPSPSPVPVDAEPRDPNYGRLLFAPTARPLKRGDGAFTDHELVFPGVTVGLTDHLSIGAGISMLPELDLGRQLFYISPKLGFTLGDRAAIAVGGLYAHSGITDEGDGSLAIGYAIGTFGRPDASLSVGVGVGDISGEHLEPAPIVMIGGNVTVSRHVALVGEAWLFVADGLRLSQQPVGLGVRFFGDRVSADVGVVVVGELLDEGFPFPWASISYHFGPSQAARAARARERAGLPRLARAR